MGYVNFHIFSFVVFFIIPLPLVNEQYKVNYFMPAKVAGLGVSENPRTIVEKFYIGGRTSIERYNSKNVLYVNDGVNVMIFKNIKSATGRFSFFSLYILLFLFMKLFLFGILYSISHSTYFP